MAYLELSYEEALKWIDIDSGNEYAAPRFARSFQVSLNAAKKFILDHANKKLICRLGALGKKYNSKIKLASLFRPFSYQEMLAINHKGKWNSSKAKKLKKFNLITMSGYWTTGKDSSGYPLAKPGRSNHNFGMAVDIVNTWLRGMSSKSLEPYGLVKNVSSENYHISMIEAKKFSGTSFLKNAIAEGLEPVIAPCGMQGVYSERCGMGSSVWLVQQELKQLGYLKDSVDGLFGAKTAAAVKAWQKARGLPQTGRIDRIDINIMFPKYAIA